MDFINIIGTFFDNSIEHVAALAHQIKDLRLNKNQQDINQDVYKKINEFEEINQETDERLKSIENGNIDLKETFKHKLVTSKEYENLEYYEKDVLYLVVNSFNEETSVFGETFPFILGGEEISSHFGDKFPIVLD